MTSSRILARLGKALLLCSAGAAAIEAAIVLPVLLLFGFGTIQGGKALWTLNELQFAAEDTARCRAIEPSVCSDDAHSIAYAQARIVDWQLPASAITLSTPACGKQVSISYNYFGNIPGTAHFTPALTAMACHPA